MVIFGDKETDDATAATALFEQLVAHEDPDSKEKCRRLFLKTYAEFYLAAKKEYFSRTSQEIEVHLREISQHLSMLVHDVETAKGQSALVIAQRLGRSLGSYLGFFEYGLINWCIGYSSETNPIYHDDESPYTHEKILPIVLERSREFAAAMHNIGRPVSTALIGKRLKRICTRNQGKLSDRAKKALLAVAGCFVK